MVKFSIITTCLNAEEYIKETIESVIYQTEFVKSNCELEYIIVDGGSEDNTNSIIEKYKKKCPQIKHIVEKDKGLYDGLSKGFKHITGDIMGYLNAGDFFNKSAFSVLKNVFKNQDVNWVTGLKVIYNQDSEITKIQIPYNFRSSLIRCGAYGKYLPFIQQESTFWRPKLIEEVNIDFFKTLKKSGDMYLWYSFAKKNKLFIVNSYLSGFKYHDSQLTFQETGSTDLYLQESKKFVTNIGIKNFFYILIDLLPWFLGRNITSVFSRFNNNFIDYLTNNKSWQSKRRKNFVCWICDYSKTNGEGITANLFLSFIVKNDNLKKEDILIRNYKSKVSFEKLEKINPKNKHSLNFYDKYLNPFIGIFYLWYKFLLGNKVAYVNFLPLWNFIVLLLLPPNTVLGPITGTIDYDKNISGWEKIFRKYFMPIHFYLSNLILLVRYKDLYFNTSNLETVLFEKVKRKSKFNFMYNLYPIMEEDKSQKKDIDFIFYIRFYASKGTDNLLNYIKVLKEKYKIVTIGEKTNFDKIEELGLVSREKVLEICKRTKFTIISSENFYSLFCFDCISNGVKVFFNEAIKHEERFLEDKKIIPIDIYDQESSLIKIKEAYDVSTFSN